jgi:hypothetical protein
MNLLFLIALIPIPISISILLIAPSHVFALISSNQTSSNETTTNSLLKQILNELQQIHQLELHPVLSTPIPIPPSTIPGCGVGTDNSLCNVPVPPSLSVPVPPFLSLPPPSFNATTCKPQNDAGVIIYPCGQTPVFPGLEPGQPSIILPPPSSIPPSPIPPPFLANLPPDLGMGPVTDCIYTVYGVFCPSN